MPKLQVPGAMLYGARGPVKHAISHCLRLGDTGAMATHLFASPCPNSKCRVPCFTGRGAPVKHAISRCPRPGDTGAMATHLFASPCPNSKCRVPCLTGRGAPVKHAISHCPRPGETGAMATHLFASPCPNSKCIRSLIRTPSGNLATKCPGGKREFRSRIWAFEILSVRRHRIQTTSMAGA